MVFWALIFTLLLLHLTQLRGKKYYTDCSPDQNLISFAVSGCGEDECDFEGGDRFTISLVFKPKRAVHSGRAKLCGKNAKPIMCNAGVAAIPDICEYIKPKCPMEPGRVYTYEHILHTPNYSIRAVPYYKLYDEKCNVIACVEFFSELDSTNNNISVVTMVDDTVPCKN